MSLDSFSFFALAVATEDGGDGFLLLQIIGVICGILGLIFFLGSAVGMVRFPDFYTRMHAAGKGDTLSTMLMLGGFGLVTMDDLSVGSWLLLIKILGVVLFIYLTTPTSSHALMRAAFEDDEMPMTEDDLKKSKKRGKKKR
ncbi:MAG: monovalent cation/H(+) antiporter subunit G [Verrucomicrobiota bacterium]|nr:monovalent cation/H(+) antiporter subunit G [Verrucomicrobiota bacterium]MEC8243905.1 monovalent cation/H(+) antiporter subunit G [Verrucomicrobiota bacterium]